jgi:hypothetical protein
MEITVKDFIEKLKKLDQDSFIYFTREEDLDEDYAFDTFTDIKVKTPVYSIEEKEPKKEYIIVT